MLAKDKSNLKIEEIRMHKHHEIHRVKPLMPALCRIRQGKKVINWETHSLTVDNNQIILFPCGYEFILRITQKQVFILQKCFIIPLI